MELKSFPVRLERGRLAVFVGRDSLVQADPHHWPEHLLLVVVGVVFHGACARTSVGSRPPLVEFARRLSIDPGWLARGLEGSAPPQLEIDPHVLRVKIEDVERTRREHERAVDDLIRLVAPPGDDED